jgi:leucine dehydrogenase
MSYTYDEEDFLSSDQPSGKNLSLFKVMGKYQHEQVVYCCDESVGLKAIIAIHSTALGPALGGARMWPYESEQDALKDVLRLSRGMTYKAAVTGLNLGGGKAVIIGDPKKDKSEALFRSFGRFVQGLGGRYITAEDVGTNTNDMEYVRMETKNVTGLVRALGGSGDPSPVTAYGVFHGMRACAKEFYGDDSLKGLKITVQGLGQVGEALVELLAKEGAEMFITDLDPDLTERLAAKYNATPIGVNEVFKVEGNIYAPCALGGVINSESLKNFGYNIVAGSANNQLDDETVHGRMLKEKGILYAPDYVINAGGLINVWNELQGYNKSKALKEVKGIFNILQNVFEISKKENIPTHEASNRLAEKRIELLANLKRFYL